MFYDNFNPDTRRNLHHDPKAMSKDIDPDNESDVDDDDITDI
jgi:hypothetical protein